MFYSSKFKLNVIQQTRQVNLGSNYKITLLDQADNIYSKIRVQRGAAIFLLRNAKSCDKCWTVACPNQCYYYKTNEWQLDLTMHMLCTFQPIRAHCRGIMLHIIMMMTLLQEV